MSPRLSLNFNLNPVDFSDGWSDGAAYGDEDRSLRSDGYGRVFAAVSDGGCLNELRLMETYGSEDDQ